MLLHKFSSLTKEVRYLNKHACFAENKLMELYNRSLLKDIRESIKNSDLANISSRCDQFIKLNEDIILVLAKLGEFIIPGISDKEIDSFIRHELNIKSIPDCYLPGPGKGIHISFNHEKCHGIAEGRIIQSDDYVSVDISIPRNDIFGDAAWSYLSYPHNSKKKYLLKSASDYFLSVISLVSGEKDLASLACPQILTPPSPLVLLEESSGHGIGHYLHMTPFISWNESSFLQTEIPDNSFFTLEAILGFQNSSDNVHFEIPFYKTQGKISAVGMSQIGKLTL